MLLLYLAWRPMNAPLVLQWLALAGIVFLFTALCGWRNTFDLIVFPTVDGRLVLPARRPSADECREFVRLLQEKINASRSVERNVIKQVLRVLRAEDFLDEWKYQKARERFDVADEGGGAARESSG